MSKDQDPMGFGDPGWPRRRGRVRRDWVDRPPVGPPWGPGHRLRRGDIRPVLLIAFLDGPAHGYEIIRRLEERSGGLWRPSAGSVYPTLQLLEEEGLLEGQQDGGKRVYELTEAGQKAAQDASQRTPRAPWERDHDVPDSRHGELRDALDQVQMASRQVVAAGRPEQVERATAILKEARQRIYQVLAED